MKNMFKGIKFSVKSTDGSMQCESTIDEIQLEANVEELIEMNKAQKELVAAVGDMVVKVMDKYTEMIKAQNE